MKLALENLDIENIIQVNPDFIEYLKKASQKEKDDFFAYTDEFNEKFQLQDGNYPPFLVNLMLELDQYR